MQQRVAGMSSGRGHTATGEVRHIFGQGHVRS